MSGDALSCAVQFYAATLFFAVKALRYECKDGMETMAHKRVAIRVACLAGDRLTDLAAHTVDAVNLTDSKAEHSESFVVNTADKVPGTLIAPARD